MKKVAKERKRKERALKRWKQKSWLTKSLKNKRIYSRSSKEKSQLSLRKRIRLKTVLSAVWLAWLDSFS